MLSHVRIDLEAIHSYLETTSIEDVRGLLNGIIELKLLGENYSIKSGTDVVGPRSKALVQDGVYLTFTADGLRLFLRALGLRGIEPDVLVPMNIEKSLSTDIDLNSIKRCITNLFKISYVSPLDEVAKGIEATRTESEERADSLEQELETAKSQLEELQCRLKELEQSSHE